MGLPADASTLIATAPMMRDAGIRRVEYDADGTVRSVEFYHRADTIPAPASSGTFAIGDSDSEFTFPEEPRSEAIAREFGLVVTSR